MGKVRTQISLQSFSLLRENALLVSQHTNTLLSRAQLYCLGCRLDKGTGEGDGKGAALRILEGQEVRGKAWGLVTADLGAYRTQLHRMKWKELISIRFWYFHMIPTALHVGLRSLSSSKFCKCFLSSIVGCVHYKTMRAQISWYNCNRLLFPFCTMSLCKKCRKYHIFLIILNMRNPKPLA